MKDAVKTRKLTPRPKIFVVKTIHHHVAMVTYKYRLVAVYTPRVQTLRYVIPSHKLWLCQKHSIDSILACETSFHILYRSPAGL